MIFCRRAKKKDGVLSNSSLERSIVLLKMYLFALRKGALS